MFDGLSHNRVTYHVRLSPLKLFYCFFLSESFFIKLNHYDFDNKIMFFFFFHFTLWIFNALQSLQNLFDADNVFSNFPCCRIIASVSHIQIRSDKL